MICSVCHELVEETTFVHASCSYDVHRRCALGSVEDAISRARANCVRTLTHRVSCPNPALHAVHQEVNLHTLLQQICGLGGYADTSEERAIDARVTAAKLRLPRSSTTSTGTVDMSRSANDRAEEDIAGDLWRGSSATTGGNAICGG